MLGNVRKLQFGSSTVQEIGTVTGAIDGEWQICAGAGEYRARKAVSCLVAPQAGDEVLLAVAENGRAWVLAVLEREEGAALELEATGDVAWRLRNGRFSVAAQQGLELTTTGKASVIAGELRVTAAEAGANLDRLSYLGRMVHAEVEKVKLFAGSLDTVADRVWQRVKRSFRFVAEVDQVRADQLDYSAKENAHLRGRNALVTAEKLVKMDGEQIHLG